MKNVSIDRGKRLKQEPHTGHNRWHPDIPPIVEADLGEEVVLETRDASDGQSRGLLHKLPTRWQLGLIRTIGRMETTGLVHGCSAWFEDKWEEFV